MGPTITDKAQEQVPSIENCWAQTIKPANLRPPIIQEVPREKKDLPVDDGDGQVFGDTTQKISLEGATLERLGDKQEDRPPGPLSPEILVVTADSLSSNFNNVCSHSAIKESSIRLTSGMETTVTEGMTPPQMPMGCKSRLSSSDSRSSSHLGLTEYKLSVNPCKMSPFVRHREVSEDQYIDEEEIVSTGDAENNQKFRQSQAPSLINLQEEDSSAHDAMGPVSSNLLVCISDSKSTLTDTESCHEKSQTNNALLLWDALDGAPTTLSHASMMHADRLDVHINILQSLMEYVKNSNSLIDQLNHLIINAQQLVDIPMFPCYYSHLLDTISVFFAIMTELVHECRTSAKSKPALSNCYLNIWASPRFQKGKQ
ncbi:hypothetical protein NDU88_002508 [Pleurodeles waltl]|uniref:Uncharacterized protein n=1 Tax=Pleurodeles waltl TaxID=8319 RepID=A0AAV7M2E5_PLEWA|nr:hypothetical protein NDU88_002508 [Pleurodeles waltl]